ncbi:hypothetical protein GWN42_11835 [candidate division KSB1 bacterium]|nr:hypothetical protein [candidate division KSB1 bacterium]
MDGPTRVSTRWLHVRQVLEIKIKGTSEVVEYELNKKLAKISQMDSCPVQAPFSLSLPMAGQDFISR